MPVRVGGIDGSGKRYGREREREGIVVSTSCKELLQGDLTLWGDPVFEPQRDSWIGWLLCYVNFHRTLLRLRCYSRKQVVTPGDSPNPRETYRSEEHTSE